MSVAVLQIVTDALVGLNVTMTGESVSPNDGAYCLGALNAILDDWNADRSSAWAETFYPFTLTPSLQPHTIGPTGTWVTPVRPVSIEAMAIEISSGVWSPISIQTDPDWWAAQSMPGQANSVQYAVYYAPDVPNGSLYFANVPTTAAAVKVLTRTALTSVLLTSSLTLPQGYQSALTLTLEESIAETFGREVSGTLTRRAGQARARIFNNNLVVPALVTREPGMDGGGHWDYRTLSYK